MPTTEDAPTTELLQKILPTMLESVAASGWTEPNYLRTLEECKIDRARAALSFPDGHASVLQAYLQESRETLKEELAALDLDTMRIREKVTSGVSLWLEHLSEHHIASRKALDWITARPLGPLPMTEFVWSIADAIWTGIGDTSTGFTYVSKRTSLSAVIGSTLTVWRQNDGAEWKAFLDRRIENVMAFEKFKAKFRFPLPA